MNSTQQTYSKGDQPPITDDRLLAVGRRRLPSVETVLALPPLIVALAYLAGLIVAELLTVFSEPRIGLALHSMLLAILLLHAALVWDQPLHRLLIALTFSPLIRLISLSLPLFRFPLVYWYFITSVPLLVAALLASRILGLSWRRDLGLNLRKLPIQVVVALSGLAFGYLEYQILEPDPLASAFTWQHLLIPALILLISTGLFEEMVFRGLMQSTALETLGRFGVLFVALIFAVLHIGYQSLMDVIFVFLVGLFFGWVVYKTGSILGVTLSHGITNIVLFLVMPFLAIGA